MYRNQIPGILSQRRPRWNSGRNILCRRDTEIIKQDDVYKIQSVPKKRRNGRRVQYLVKWFGYPESVNSWIFKPDLQKRGVAVWSVSLVNGTEWHGQHIVLGHLWKKDTSTGDRISVSGTHPVHGYRSQHLQLDGRIAEQYFEDGTVERPGCRWTYYLKQANYRDTPLNYREVTILPRNEY
jgi:hypothetical protein